jgi:AcrR family transcriptional regulator
VDRRAARTRAALSRALVSLVRSKGYEAATVAEVCAAADVGRSTFYAHYAGKDDLKRRAMAAHLREVIAHGGDGADGAQSGDPFGFSLPLLQHARDHQDVRRAQAGGPGEQIALEVLGEVVREHVRAALAGTAAGCDGDTPPEAAAAFLAGAWLALHAWWLDAGARLPPQEVDAMFRRLAVQGVRDPARGAPFPRSP